MVFNDKWRLCWQGGLSVADEVKILQRLVKKMVVAGVTAMLLAVGTPHSYALAPIMPTADVREGMSGQAYTVVDSSGAIQPFDVNIVGTIDNGKGSNAMIMATADGPLIHQVGGILQGMSGSPVYINGQLVGAVAAGLKDMTPYTFFITPIEDMLPLWQMPDNKNKTHLRTVDLRKYAADQKKAKAEAEKKAKAGTKDDKELQSFLDQELAKIKGKEEAGKQGEAAAKHADTKADAAAKEAAEAEPSPAANNATKAPAETKPAAEQPQQAEHKDVLYLSGFNTAGIRFLQEQLPLGRQYQLLPVSGSLGLQADNTDYHASLRPGDPVGVAIVYGDFAVGATGTVTATDGKRILAFGHPFLHKGNVNYFMTKASVVGTISGTSNGMKMANIGAIIGRINQDRDTGIAGKIGDFPSVVPIKVKVQDKSLGRTENYGARIAYDEDFLPQLSGGVTYAAMSKVADTLGGSTANVKFTIRTNAVKEGKIERSNMFYNTADVGQIAVAEIMQAMNIICGNTDKESDILDLQVDVTMDNERKTASLLSVVPDKVKVHPGETVKFTVTIKPYRRDKETLLINYTVPENQRAGALNLDVRGGGLVPVTNLMLLQQSGIDVATTYDKKKTTEDKLHDFQKTGRNNEIIIAPGASPVELTDKQKKAALREAQKVVAEAARKAQAEGHKANLLGAHKKAANTGETKFTTKYIIDNVLHTTLQVERK